MTLSLLLMFACGGDAEPVKQAAPPVAAAPADAKSPLDRARVQLRKGKADEAFTSGEAVLVAHPEDDAAWDFVELAAIRAGKAGELVDRLSADQALGGRTDRHQALRGVLALE